MEELDTTGEIYTPEPIFPKEESNFVDIDNNRWSYEAVKRVTELKLLVPYKTEEGNKFYPTQNVTREEFCVALAKLLDIIDKKLPSY